MLQPFAINNAKSPREIAFLLMESTTELHDWEEWSCTTKTLATFNCSYLQKEAKQIMATHRQIVSDWRALNHGVTSRLAILKVNDVALSFFCWLMAIWILSIWRSDAPFWWVPLLAIFFGVAAVAALHDAIGSTPQMRRAAIRKQLRQTRAKMAKLQNRLAMLRD